MQTGLPDNELIPLVIKGDQQAYKVLVERYQSYIFTLAYRLMQSREDAEEVAQDVFVKAYRSLADFKGGSKFSTWIYTIARNCRTDMFRRLQKFDTPLAEEDVFPDQESEEPFALLQGKRSEERVRELMKTLPGDQMRILAKVYMEGKSHAEAAAELDLPLGTVKSRVRLAIQKLQIQIDR